MDCFACNWHYEKLASRIGAVVRCVGWSTHDRSIVVCQRSQDAVLQYTYSRGTAVLCDEMGAEMK